MSRWRLATALVVAWVLPAAAAELKVIQKDERFSEREMTARVGDRLTFVNADSVKHNVFSETTMAFDIEQAPGRSDTVVLDSAGQLDIECAIHPKMRLKVKVESKRAW